MLGLPILPGIVDLGFVDVKDLVLRLERPMVVITTQTVGESRIGLGGSKFGGHPDLPEDVDWPRCEKGRFAFLAQIALPDLKATQVAHVLPKDGLLSFFAYDHDGLHPGNFTPEEGVTEVLYTPAMAKLIRRETPRV